MKRIRIGKDISMRWEITTDGVAIPLDGRDLTVEIKSPAGIENNIPYRIDGNILIMTYYGYEQKRTGEYSITLWEKKGKPGQNVVDVIRAFELVRTSQEENDFVGGDLQIESVDLGTENFDILTEGGYRAINIDTLQAEVLDDSVNIKGKTYSNESFTITLPKANLDSAGVMSADDKQTLQDHGNRIAQINTTLDEHTESINAKLNELEGKTSELEPKNTEEDGFYICDAKGNVLIRLDVLDTKGGVGESLANSIRSIIQGVGAIGFDSLEAQEIGTELSKIINGFNDVKEVAEDGFYICNGDGEAVAKFIDDKWEFLGLTTILRKGAETEKYASLSAGTYILGNFPKYLKMGRTVTLSADVEQFGTIEIGVINTTKRTITIDSTNITLATDGSSRKTVAHGLTISGQLRVTFVADMLEAKAIIDCNGEQYIFKHTSDSYAYANNLDCSAYGNVGMIVGGSTILNNVVLSSSSNYFGKDVWIFGDSYTSIDSGARWPNHVLFDFEYKNFMICGLSGGSSAQLYADLEKCLQYGVPKEIIWLLGMNNGDLADAPNPSWLENLEKVEKICRDKGIELVLGTIPCTNQSTNDNSFKNEVIKSRGHRYINFAKAVGAEIKGSSWYEGMKEPDPGIHPSVLGAKVLAAQILTDCPELTK